MPRSMPGTSGTRPRAKLRRQPVRAAQFLERRVCNMGTDEREVWIVLRKCYTFNV